MEAQKSAKSTTAIDKTSEGFTDEERAAMKEHAQELKAGARHGRRTDKDGKVVCFFQGAQKFKTRYATFGFSDQANLDEDSMWPTAFALTGLTAAEAAGIDELVKRAVSRV